MPTNEWLKNRNRHIKQAHIFYKELEKILAEHRKNNNKKNKNQEVA
jgi:hypothetical protein